MPRQKKHDFSRALIAESAAAVFARRGYHGATMDEIAREAGYSAAAIYKYYRGKQELFVELLHVLGERYFGLFREPMPPELGFEARLRFLLRKMGAFAVNDRELFRASLSHFAMPAEDLPAEAVAEMRAAHFKYLADVSAFIATGIAEGSLRDMDPLDGATAFLGIFHAFAGRWLMSESAEAPERYGDAIVDLFLRGVQRAPG